MWVCCWVQGEHEAKLEGKGSLTVNKAQETGDGVLFTKEAHAYCQEIRGKETAII